MENQAASSKKRKNSEDALSAGFKKALVSSTGGSDVFGDVALADFNKILESAASVKAESAQGARQQQHQQQQRQQQGTTSVSVDDNHHGGSISDLSLNSNHHASTPSAAAVDAASAAVMTTMADLLANAGDSS
ncbi:hypothetical protein BGZ98_007392, partial [Dissophora globulifera]